MGKLKQQLQDGGTTTVHWDFRKGSVNDQSGNGNTGIFINSPHWVNTEKGKALELDTNTQNGVYVDGSGFSTAAMSVAMWVKMRQSGSADYFFSFNGDEFSCLNGGVGIRVFYDGAQVVNVALPVSVQEYFHLAATWTQAGTLKLFINGVEQGSAALGAPAITAGNFVVGASGSAGNFSISAHVAEAMLFDSELTEFQVATLYQESLQEAFFVKTPVQSRIPTPSNHPSEPDNLAGHWDMELNGTTISDLSGNGNDASITTGQPVQVQGFYGRGLDFSDNARLTVSDQTAIQNIFDSGGSVSFWIYPRSDGGGNNGRVMAKGNEPWNIVTQDSTASGFGDIQFNYDFDGAANGGWETTTNGIAYNAWNHVVITYDNGAVGNDPTIYVNGSSQAITENSTPVGTRVTDVAGDLYIGDRQDDTRGFDGIIDEIKLYSDTLTATEVSDLYSQGSGRADLNLLGDDLEVSADNVSSGFIENSGFQVNSGNWQVDDVGGIKQLKCTSAGFAYIKSTYAFGTWEFDVLPQDASSTHTLFIADTIGFRTDASQDGYTFDIDANEALILQEMTGGAVATKLKSANGVATAGSFIRIRITRSMSGEFTLYHSTDNGASWTQTTASSGSNPFTDTTVTTSKYIVLDYDANDAIRNLRYYPTVQDPTA